MKKLKEAIKQIGYDIGSLKDRQVSSLTIARAYELFPTYATLQSQMATNIKTKHLDLGLDALIDDKLKNGGDFFITNHQAQTTYATIEKLKELEKKIDSIDTRLKRIEANQL